MRSSIALSVLSNQPYIYSHGDSVKQMRAMGVLYVYSTHNVYVHVCTMQSAVCSGMLNAAWGIAVASSSGLDVTSGD